MHGGTNQGKPIITGRYSLKRQSLAGNYQQFKADPVPVKLFDELALLRGLLQEFLNRYPDGTPLDLKAIRGVAGLIHDIGEMAERIERIHNASALTAAEVDLLRVLMAGIIIDFVPEDKRADAIQRLRQSLPADDSYRPDSSGSAATVEATATAV